MRCSQIDAHSRAVRPSVQCPAPRKWMQTYMHEQRVLATPVPVPMMYSVRRSVGMRLAMLGLVATGVCLDLLALLVVLVLIVLVDGKPGKEGREADHALPPAGTP